MNETTAYETDTPTSAPSTGAKIARGLGAFALGGALLAVLIALGGLTLARYDLIDKLSGFRAFMMMMWPAGVIAIVALLAMIIGFVVKGGGGKRWKAGLALVLSAGLVLVMYTQVVMPAGKAPPIHDVSTDLNNMPQFVALDVAPVSTGPFSQEEWRAFHTEAYSNIEPILIDRSPSEVLAAARVLMEQRGWTVAETQPVEEQLEATAYAGYLRFRDDVVVRVTPVMDGSTRVDMRSVSRVGVSDLGFNARRVRDFLKDLSAA
ncbi:DUF1499 domain-containing protein [Aurantiacibacter flavus]|uniref:DUF1499 domain-containing protein n=1 Tax=Aurantiacibacter flavus TaxID=3145232 RepID=A0ABV0CSD2_9SPHN